MAQKSDAKASDNRSGADARGVLLKSFLERQTAADAPAAPAVVETVTPPAQPAAQVTEPTTSVTEPATTPDATEPATTPVTTEEPAPVTTETEPTAEPEEIEATGADSVLSQLSSLDPATREVVQDFLLKQKAELHENVQKRIGKERAMRGQLEKEIAQLKSATPQKPEIIRVPAPTDTNPLADVADVQTLTQRHAEAKEAKRWAQTVLDGENWQQVESGGKQVDAVNTGDRWLTKADVKGILRNAQAALEDHIPARLQFLTRKQQVQQAAFVEFPYLKDRNSVEYQEAEKYRAAYPQLAVLPDADLLIGYAMEGLKTVEARKKAATAAGTTKPKVTAKPPPASQTAVPATAAAPRLTGDQQAKRGVAAEKEKMAAKGNVSGDDLRRYFLKSSLSR